MYSAHQVTREFEAALCEYTGALYAVTTTSCTMALLLAVKWHLQRKVPWCRECGFWPDGMPTACRRGAECRATEIETLVNIPKRTYVGVPMSIIHAGGWPTFRDEEWSGAYQLKPLPVWDCARRFTSKMYEQGQFQCVSFHWGKILGLQQGGAILHDDPEADEWFRRARFDGRREGVAPKDDRFDMLGWHCYMSPEVAALGLMKLSLLPKHNADLPNDPYPDLSQHEVFR